MFILTILAKDARRLGYLVAANPLRDPGEQDQFVDLRLEAATEEDALQKAEQMAAEHALGFWELLRVSHIKGCSLIFGE